MWLKSKESGKYKKHLLDSNKNNYVELRIPEENWEKLIKVSKRFIKS